MVRVKGPLFSMGASGTLGGAISYRRQLFGAQVERKPRKRDFKSAAQLNHRALFLKGVAYWHSLSAAEKENYKQRGNVLHMTGFNLCVRDYLLGAIMAATSGLRTTGAEVLLPTLAASPALAVGDGEWPETWTQIVGETASAYALCGVSLCFWPTMGTLGTVGQIGQVRIGVGGVGEEVPIGQGAFGLAGLQLPVGGSDTVFAQANVPIPFKPVLVPAGERLSGQIANINGVAAGAVVLTGYEGWDEPSGYEGWLPDVYWKGESGGRAVVVPDAGAATVTAGSPAWTFGDGVDLYNVTMVATVLKGIVAVSGYMMGSKADVQFEVVVGSPGSEEVVARGGLVVPAAGRPGGTAEFRRPYLAEAGTRVRVRGAAGMASSPWKVCLLAEEME